jgi:microcompartment protein CcmL/EutN
LSEAPLDPAIALVELSSIAAGIEAGDAMVKTAPLGSIYAGTVHPGKYLVLVSGDTASVDEALAAGLATGGAAVLATVFLPDIHPAVTAAIAEAGDAAWLGGEALGVVETVTVAAVIEAADAGVKAAAVELSAVRLADGLGGKGYALFSGVLAEVEAAVEAAVDRSGEALIARRLIPQLHDEMAENLGRHLRFLHRVSMRSTERGA